MAQEAQRFGPADGPEDAALGDCLYALQATVPHLARSSLHGCLVRHGIEHRLTKPNHPAAFWTNGPVERTNRAIKEAAVERSHCGDHDQPRSRPAAVLLAYNVAERFDVSRPRVRRLKQRRRETGETPPRPSGASCSPPRRGARRTRSD